MSDRDIRVSIQEHLYSNTSPRHESLFRQHRQKDNVVNPKKKTGKGKGKKLSPQKETKTERRKRLKPVADLLKQLERRAAVVEALGPGGLICTRWIPSRWITHATNSDWEVVITALEQQRDWAEQRITDILQIPAENVPDVVKSNGVTIPF
jgi:hypothetical protein